MIFTFFQFLIVVSLKILSQRDLIFLSFFIHLLLAELHLAIMAILPFDLAFPFQQLIVDFKFIEVPLLMEASLLLILKQLLVFSYFLQLVAVLLHVDNIAKDLVF